MTNIDDIEPYWRWPGICPECGRYRCECEDESDDDDCDYGLEIADRHEDAVNDYLYDNGY